VPIHYLAAEIINPLDQTDGQMILGQPIAPAVKAPGARLCADAARHLFRFRDDWARELGKNASPLDVALRLLDRAAQLDKKAEYLAWHGLILFEQPRFGPADVDRAAADAAGAIATNDKYCGGHVLDGMVRAWRGKVQSDARDRLKLCTEADEQFKKAELLAGADNRGELVALYQRAADNDIQLAALKPQKPDKAEYLARSKARAEKLLELEPARNAVRETLACALEDQAWLVKSDKRFGADGLYAQAIAEFTRALGGFGDRSKARLDRGRCRFKWAEDKFKSKEDGGRLDEPLLGDAKDDLTEAVNAAPDSNDAVEAHYWLAQVERLRYKAIVDLNSPRSGTQHAAAVAELEAGLKLARDLQNPFWAEPIAQEWASAALGEVNRLYAVNKTQLPRAVADATRAAEELKPYSAPWYALLRMLLLPAERKNDSAGYYQELVERSKGGLGPCRQQDRIIQFSIYITRADARVLFGTPDVGLDFKSALADAEAAERIAHELEMTNERAYARGLMGLARMRLVVTGASSRERIAYRKAATDDFRAALKLAPDHFAAWQWKVLQAVTLERKDPFEATDTAEIATYFADQYRIFREMKPPISPSPGHEKNLIAEVDRNCADLEKNQAVRLRDAIITDKEKKHPDRAKWQLGLAEMDAHSDDPKWLAEARTQFDVALSSLTPEAQKPHAAQIARIRDVLAKAEKK
jgi:tetratricopeptide (TPR) repeat protein